VTQVLCDPIGTVVGGRGDVVDDDWGDVTSVIRSASHRGVSGSHAGSWATLREAEYVIADAMDARMPALREPPKKVTPDPKRGEHRRLAGTR
jgi:hypothetical protein